MSAVIDAVAGPPSDGQADLADIPRLPDLAAKDLFAVAEVLHIFEFAELKDGAIKLTAAGRVFAQCEAKALAALQRTPVALCAFRRAHTARSG